MIPYDYKGETHHMTRAEFVSVRHGHSIEHYALGQNEVFANPTDRSIYQLYQRMSDGEIADLLHLTPSEVSERRRAQGLKRTYKWRVWAEWEIKLAADTSLSRSMISRLIGRSPQSISNQRFKIHNARKKQASE